MPLESLDLSDCISIKDANLANLQGLPLTYLDLSGIYVGALGIANLQGLPLTYLDLSGEGNKYPPRNNVGAGLVHLKEMPLESLRLFNTNVTDNDLAELSMVST